MHSESSSSTDTEKPFEHYPHILVVDDDARILELVSRYLTREGFVTLTAENGPQARRLLQRFEFDAAVVDVMMPGESGLDLTSFIQQDYKTLPVLLLTALGEVDDRLAGFEAGADDYLPKPFEPKELVMRLLAILKRSRQNNTRDLSRFRIGPWIFNEASQSLDLENGDAVAVRLSEIDIQLIKALAKTPGEPVSREILAKSGDMKMSERNIDVQITRLRKKIEKDTKNPLYLQTVRGKGYLLRTEPI